jgi:hypothetical protein
MRFLRKTKTPARDPRHVEYLRVVRADDVLLTFRNTPDDLLIEIGAGLAVAAFEGEYERVAYAAKTFYGIRRDALDLLASTYLATVTPNMGRVILARPNEATVLAVRSFLRQHGIDARAERPRVAREAEAAVRGTD